jgi:hypothetical protein
LKDDTFFFNPPTITTAYFDVKAVENLESSIFTGNTSFPLFENSESFCNKNGTGEFIFTWIYGQRLPPP